MSEPAGATPAQSAGRGLRAGRSRAALAEIRAVGVPDDADLSAAARERRAEISRRLG